MFIDFLMLVLLLVVMFIPSIVAFHRDLKRKWACLILNILLGWTVYLWPILLVWSLLTSATNKAPAPTV